MTLIVVERYATIERASKRTLMVPTKEEAIAFAIILQAGLPPSEAILYFCETDDPVEIQTKLGKWMRSREVKKAQVALMGKSWQDMSLDERCRYGLDQHYSALAWLLFSNHYAEVGSADKAKLDSARTAIEARMAGTSGKQDALSSFLSDLQTGKVKIAGQAADSLKGKLN